MVELELFPTRCVGCQGHWFFQKMENFVDFFRQTKLIIRASEKSVKIVFESKPRNSFLGSFWTVLTKKLGKLAQGPPSNLVYIGAKGPFRKIYDRFSENLCHKLVPKGVPLGGVGSNP